MKIIKSLNFTDLVYRLISSILFFNIVNLIKNNFNYDIGFMQNLGIFKILLSLVIIFIILSIIRYVIKKQHTDYVLMIVSLFLCSILWLGDNNIFFVTIIFLLNLLLYHFRPKDLDINSGGNLLKYLVIMFGILMFTHIATLGILRYKTFGAPNFDLGIPGQNFYYLKKIGIPFSTCERDRLVNHLMVHFSPIYYFILPVYFIFSHVMLLPIISALLISLSIIPLYLLCKNSKLSKMVILFVCLIFSTYAPAICSTYYDFHENHFLIPLLLWLFYFYEKNNKWGLAIFSILILLIKEDAAIYLIIFSIFMILDKKSRYGIPLLVFSVLYFSIITYYLSHYGNGIMMDRYNNLVYDGNGMFGVIKTLLINPGYFIRQLITSQSGNYDKIKYMLQLLLPLGFIPLYSKEKKNYILLIPILLTLMTTYQYSYNINFHYSCGIIAFLFYLFIKNIKDLKIKNYILICLITSVLTYRTYAYPYFYETITNYINNKEELMEVEKLLREIPKDVSINASAFMVPHLINRDIIYEVYYHGDLPDIDYVVLDTRYSDYKDHYDQYINNGYIKWNEIKNKVIILKK